MSRPAWRMNVAELLVDDRLERWGPSIALRAPGELVDTARLARRVEALSGALGDLGIRRGTRVALALPDGPLWCITFLALARVGAVAALASPATPPDRLRDALLRARPDVLAADADLLGPGIRRLDPTMLAAAEDAGAGDPGPAATRPSDPCYLLMTSGSSGPPKWAVHTHGHIAACLATYGRHVLRLEAADVSWSVAALPTSYGLGNTLYFPLGAGASSWMTGDPPTPQEAVRACREAGATVLFGVPTFWARLARHAAEGRITADAFTGVRLGVSAGEPLPPAVWYAARDTLGIALVDGLGSSEATNLYVSQRPGRARPGSVGRCVPGFTLRIEGTDGAQARAGEVGELLVRGPTVMSGYFDAPEATAHALRGGWLHTGDLVMRAPDASYRFVGRAGERFKASGQWVDPSRVEAALMAHPEVAEAGVAGVPDAEGVVRVAAAIVPRGDVDPATLRHRLDRLAAAELAPHEVPRTIICVDALPTTASGKVRRAELRELLSRHVAAVA